MQHFHIESIEPWNEKQDIGLRLFIYLNRGYMANYVCAHGLLCSFRSTNLTNRNDFTSRINRLRSRTTANCIILVHSLNLLFFLSFVFWFSVHTCKKLLLITCYLITYCWSISLNVGSASILSCKLDERSSWHGRQCLLFYSVHCINITLPWHDGVYLYGTTLNTLTRGLGANCACVVLLGARGGGRKKTRALCWWRADITRDAYI